MFTNTPSDKVQLVGRGDLIAPGCCAVCGNGNSDMSYVDVGLYWDYHGQVYFCITCAMQVSEVIGCLIPSEVEILKEQCETALAGLRKKTAELEAANERLRAFDVAFSSVKFPDAASDFVINPANSVNESSNEVDAESSESASSGESEVKEPVVIPRRGNSKRNELRDLTSGDNQFQL